MKLVVSNHFDDGVYNMFDSFLFRDTNISILVLIWDPIALQGPTDATSVHSRDTYPPIVQSISKDVMSLYRRVLNAGHALFCLACGLPLLSLWSYLSTQIYKRYKL